MSENKVLVIVNKHSGSYDESLEERIRDVLKQTDTEYVFAYTKKLEGQEFSSAFKLANYAVDTRTIDHCDNYAIAMVDATFHELRGKFTHILSFGGDGTFNEVINGYANNQNRKVDPTFMIVSDGTGNDVAESLGFIQRDRDGRKRFFDQDLLVTALKENLRTKKNTLEIHTGQAIITQEADHTSKRYFINQVGFGISADVADAVNQKNRATIYSWSVSS